MNELKGIVKVLRKELHDRVEVFGVGSEEVQRKSEEMDFWLNKLSEEE